MQELVNKMTLGQHRQAYWANIERQAEVNGPVLEQNTLANSCFASVNPETVQQSYPECKRITYKMAQFWLPELWITAQFWQSESGRIGPTLAHTFFVGWDILYYSECEDLRL